MSKKCKHCGENFDVESADLSFLNRVSPEIAGQKFEIPEPTFCYSCRLQRRFSWRNDMNLYHRKCDQTGEKVISMFSPDSDMTVYHKDYWWGDEWDATSYGRDYDFDKTFFKQFAELNREVPHMHVLTLNDENSDYTNYNTDNKNCYLCFAGNYSEDCLYCYNAQHSKSCVDCLFVWNSEILFQCVQCEDCYQCFYCSHSKNCSNSMFLDDCLSCRDCFMCANLRNKQYCILNQQYTKDEYFDKCNDLLAGGYSECLEDWNMERKKFPKRANRILQSENCTGEYIWQGKNCRDCYIMAGGCEDCSNVFNGFPFLKDASDCTFCGEKSELMYECHASGVNCSRMAFGNLCLEGSSEVYYSSFIFGCKNCFGCSNLRKKQYCILNKQYTKEEYEKLLPKVIDHMKTTREWGEYFPTEISPFAYNESFGDLYFPLEKKEVLKRGWKWLEKDENDSGDFSGYVQRCEKSGRSFRFVKKEIDFYKKWNLPLPKLCFDERNKERMALMNEWKTRSANCVKCGKTIQTNCENESLYCEECYLNEVY